MNLSRKFLKALGIEDEKIDNIIEAHMETVNALKEERDGYQTKAKQLDDVQKQLDDLKAKGDDGYKAKYEDEKKAHDALKDEVAKKRNDRRTKPSSEKYCPRPELEISISTQFSRQSNTKLNN